MRLNPLRALRVAAVKGTLVGGLTSAACLLGTFNCDFLILGDEPKASIEPVLPSEKSTNTTYLSDLKQIQLEAARFEHHDMWKSSLSQHMAAQYSYVGRHQDAFKEFDKTMGSSPGRDASFQIDDYVPIDATTAVLDLADQYQVIMVNEAHHVPMHRAWTIGLLDDLYKKGFRYFAAEALTVKDVELTNRVYPTLKTGYYVREPLLADLVRIALRIGYEVVPYEYESEISTELTDDPIVSQNRREEGQAKNLKERILSKDPKGKILVHAGYSHIGKNSATWEIDGKKADVRFMALVFQSLTGIEPLSIDQTMMTERGTVKKERHEYHLALEKGYVKETPIILHNKKDGKPFKLSGNYDVTSDLVVFHPRSRYENGRPSWLVMGGKRKPYLVNFHGHPSPGEFFLVQAFYQDEISPDAVPVDQMAYTADDAVPTLWLPSENIRIRVIDENGKTLAEDFIKD
ncbi:hypothetical protein [Schlesneria paludicola]|uniref:hypothetical protein n=1 Tax=Schlesneria paludicola TaxID=360056 RepID=UPI00029ABD63|nr:hypothetical protein [Schlesneria paludicola]